MEESEDNTSAEDIKGMDTSSKIKPKKRSLVERELETNLTERITSPLSNGDSTSTSRYGRARKLKTEAELAEAQKIVKSLKSPPADKSLIKSPVYKMHASNSPIREIPNKTSVSCGLDYQIESIYNENISLSRFSDENKYLSPGKQTPKVYVRKDLIQSKEKDIPVTLIKHGYSPAKSNQKPNSHLSNVLERSLPKFGLEKKQNGYLDNLSVVKTLDFDGSKKKKTGDNKGVLSKSELFDLEAKCEYQVGDLAWAKMGTYPYWPCIVTRDPFTGMFVKKKLFGRVDHDVIHVTFFGDNGRRSWIVDNMLRRFLGQLEFETAREKFTPESRKKDPRCAAFFVSEKKLTQWTISVEEAETLLREPKRLRIDIFNDMLNKCRAVKTTPKGRKVSRTDSDVSLSESLYDTLFSEDDSKTNDSDRSKTKTRNKSLDVSEVVTACLDNMAAKTGITKIQKQSHMDRWLQKAKSKTPEKSLLKSHTNSQTKQNKKNKSKRIKKETDVIRLFQCVTSDNESLSENDNKLQSYQNEHDYSSQYLGETKTFLSENEEKPSDNGFGVIAKVEILSELNVNNMKNDNSDDVVVMNDECIVGEETVVDSEEVFDDINGTNSVEIKEITTIKKDTDSTIKISSVNLDNNDISIKSSDKELISNSNNFLDYTDSEAISSTISTKLLPAANTIPVDNSEISNSQNEITDTNSSENEQQTETTTGELNYLSNGDDNTMDVDTDYEECEKEYGDIKQTVLNEDSGELSTECSLNCEDDVTKKGDEEKQDVNIVKKMLSDKLVGNVVESDKTDFIIDMNDMTVAENFTVNDGSHLTIPETNGHENRVVDDSDREYNDEKRSKYIDNIYAKSKLSEDDNSSTDISQYGADENVYNKEQTLKINNSLVATVNNICSDVFYSDNTQTESSKPCESDNDSIISTGFQCHDNKQVVNGLKHNKGDLQRNYSKIRNSDFYLSSEDDERSTTSTPVDVNYFHDCSGIDKSKTKFIEKVQINLQNRVIQRDAQSVSKNIDQNIAKIEDSIHINKSFDKDSLDCEEIALHNNSQRITEVSERCSTDSNYTCDSDNKSTCSDDPTETTETTETMDVDESTFDCVTRNDCHEDNKNEFSCEPHDINKTPAHIDLSKEKAILNGDELRLTPSGLEIVKDNVKNYEDVIEVETKEDKDVDTASIISTDSEVCLSKRKINWKAEKQTNNDKKTVVNKAMREPEFLQYLELKQDAIFDEHPELSQDEITAYLYNTWLYEESSKTDRKKTDDIESANMVKGLKSEVTQPKRVKKRIKVEKEKDYHPAKEEDVVPKQKPRRRTVKLSYNEEYSDIEEDFEVYGIPKMKKELRVAAVKTEIGSNINGEQFEAIEIAQEEDEDAVDEVEDYFAKLTEPKPNVFKGLLREKVCDICERTNNLVKCKGCSSMFHVDCVKRKTEEVEMQGQMKGKKKKKKTRGRKPKSEENCLDESHSDEKDANVSEEIANTSIETAEPESHIVANADDFEAQLEIKMKELLGDSENVHYDSFSSDCELDWSDTEAGKCKVVDIKLRKKSEREMDYSDFKCDNCQKYDVPICFVCRSAESPANSALHRQRCQVPHCNKYYHLECLEHWPQTQFNSGECARYNKKINEYFEALSCPRHVCHTCVSDDPRGCKTRFSGDKLARCVRCPATYHSFTKCLPAGSQILSGSHIICPRHYEHRPGKVPCHVNTGWCFICALGGTLICCEYCPTSFHAECLNIKPPEGNYMCEDCETGRLPLYGEMVWVKLGHYRWWPGIILHPCEIPENILAVKHSPGEFVVRFFGQYDHYWVNRGRVFPFQEGDSGKVSSQKSKIDAAFTMAMEHAQRACEILKNATANEEESLDIASSLLPPHYVKLRVNKPVGALVNRRTDALEEGSLTQCECSPTDEQPCGPYTHCLNRMLLTECGPTCRAGERCNNRAFEKRLYPKLVPYRTPQRGWGLKTLEDIKAGQFVIEYVGELIDEEEFQRRMRRKHEMRDENFYFLTLDKERMIDAGPKGNLARFMNHCCEPNCETQKWTVLGDIRVGLFAIYDIPANSEVTFNYNLESAGIEKKRCFCGAKRCSGYIGAKPKQADQPKKNKVAAKRTYKKRKIEDSPSTSKTKPKGKVGRPVKPRELTDIEKDLMIIKNATNGMSSDSECSGRLSSIDSAKDQRAMKRKRVNYSTEDSASNGNSPSTKRSKLKEERSNDLCD